MAVLSKFYGTSRLLRPAGLPSAGLRCGAAHKWAARAAPPYLPPEPGRARMLFLPGFKARFHAIYGGWEVIVGIAPVRIVEGEARERVRATVLEWAKAHQMELLKGWGGLAAAERPETIEPLS